MERTIAPDTTVTPERDVARDIDYLDTSSSCSLIFFLLEFARLLTINTEEEPRTVAGPERRDTAAPDRRDTVVLDQRNIGGLEGRGVAGPERRYLELPELLAKKTTAAPERRSTITAERDIDYCLLPSTVSSFLRYDCY
jgi:hypothetical protein